jgi:hypothetical protein
LTLIDTLGAAAVDFDDTTFNSLSLTSDADGRFWRLPLTAASGSTTSVINVSQTLTVDAWKGRWIWINDEQVKVISNTASALTLLTPLSFAPANGDRGGIIMEVMTTHSTFPSGVESLSVKAPITIGLSYAGYQTLSFEHEFDTPEIDLCAALLPDVAGGGGVFLRRR